MIKLPKGKVIEPKADLSIRIESPTGFENFSIQLKGKDLLHIIDFLNGLLPKEVIPEKIPTERTPINIPEIPAGTIIPTEDTPVTNG